MKKKIITKKQFNQLITAIIVILLILIGQFLQPNETNNNATNENNENIITTANIEISDIPPYTGETVITINNDKTYFEEKEISTENFEDYSKLDKYQRAGVAFANICKYTIPPEGV